MHCPDLVRIFELIREYTECDTNEKIASKLGITDRTLRRNLYEHPECPFVPKRQHKNYQAFFSETLAEEISPERTRALLLGDVESFHNLISPISGPAWSKLISQSQNSTKLNVRKRPPPSFGFGVSAQLVDQPAEFELKIGDQFALDGKADLNGEAIVLMEQHSVWHVARLEGEKTINKISGSTFTLPRKVGEAQLYLKEVGPPGFYRYFVLATKGAFPRSFRELVNSANPLTQAQLDQMAQVFQNLSSETIIMGTTILVKDHSA